MRLIIDRTKEIAVGWARVGIALAVVFVLVYVLMVIGAWFGIGPPPM